MGRRAAVTLAGAALLLALGRAPAIHAATIDVDGTTCTLVDAIRSANANMALGGCDTGSGADTLNLLTDVTLTTAYGYLYFGDTGLPLVTSNITIEGNGNTIERDGAAPDFRILAVSTGGNLTLNNVTISGGKTPNSGGAIFNRGTVAVTNSTVSNNMASNGGGIRGRYGAALSITNSTISNNTAGSNGGGLYLSEVSEAIITNSRITGNTGNAGGGIKTASNSGDLTITDSLLSDNFANDRGGAVYAQASLSISNSTISDNDANSDGGGVFGRDVFEISYSTIRDNTSGRDGGGIYNDGDLTLSNSTVSGNDAIEDGGGLYNGSADSSTITNSTFSGNTATEGGGLYAEFGTGNLTVSNSTFIANSATNGGGMAIRDVGSTLSLNRTLISGNVATNGRELYNDGATVTAANYNLFGRSGISDAQAFVGFTPGATDLKATNDGTPILLADILEITLQANGGPESGPTGNEEAILTHALVDDSVAIDAAPDTDCSLPPVNGIDQRGAARNADGDGSASGTECDIGAFEYGAVTPPGAEVIYASATAAGTTDDSIPFRPEDILRLETGDWEIFFDGSAEGLPSTANINAMHVNAADDLILGFSPKKFILAGLGSVFGNDLLAFDGNNFDFFFDGSDVGLTTVAERIDALHVLDGSVSPIGAGCQHYLLISTAGSGRVTDHTGAGLLFNGEDILGFCLSNPGAVTAGVWHMVLDGSAVGMPKNSTVNLSANDEGTIISFTTKAFFDVPPAAGGHSSIFQYNTTTETFSGPFFVALDEGLDKPVDGLHVEGDLP